MPPKAAQPSTPEGSQRLTELTEIALQERLEREATANRDYLAREKAFHERKLAIELRAVEDLAAATAARAAAGSTPRAQSPATVAPEASELPPSLAPIASEYSFIPRPLLMDIFNNRFDPRNLCRLRIGAEIEHQDDTAFVSYSSDGRIHARKPMPSNKKFGSTNAIWSEGFLAYVSILSAFNPSVEGLTTGLLNFHRDIIILSRSYSWATAVLPLALNFHRERQESSVTDKLAWRMPEYKIAVYTRTAAPPEEATRYQPYGRPLESRPLRFDPNDSSVTCKNFGLYGSCQKKDCRRRHEASGSKS